MEPMSLMRLMGFSLRKIVRHINDFAVRQEQVRNFDRDLRKTVGYVNKLNLKKKPIRSRKQIISFGLPT
jgi:hypothetical protein